MIYSTSTLHQWCGKSVFTLVDWLSRKMAVLSLILLRLLDLHSQVIEEFSMTFLPCVLNMVERLCDAGR